MSDNPQRPQMGLSPSEWELMRFLAPHLKHFTTSVSMLFTLNDDYAASVRSVLDIPSEASAQEVPASRIVLECEPRLNQKLSERGATPPIDPLGTCSGHTDEVARQFGLPDTTECVPCKV